MAYDSVIIDAPKIKFKGVFDFDGLYKYLKGWLKSKSFSISEGTYKDKGGEFEIEWDAVKNVTDYYRYKISIKFFGWDISKIELIDEKTKKPRVLDKGRIEITIKGEIIEDYAERWNDAGWFTKKIYVLYRNLKRPARNEIHANFLYDYVYGMYDIIKEHLNMSSL